MNTTGKKFGGRKKGTPNKITKELKETLQDVINAEIQELPVRLNELETKDRINLLAKLLPYVLPKEIEQANFEHKEETIRLKYIDSSKQTPNKVEFEIIQPVWKFVDGKKENEK